MECPISNIFQSLVSKVPAAWGLPSYKRNLLLTLIGFSLHFSKGTSNFLVCIRVIFILCVHVSVYEICLDSYLCSSPNICGSPWQPYGGIAFPTPFVVDGVMWLVLVSDLWAECMWVTCGLTNESSVKNSLEFSFTLAQSQWLASLPGSLRSRRPESSCHPIMDVYYKQDFITFLF